ncbi:hypothetical protein [Escherichia coli]|uniref:hypothetical protein n=1 Tax=Escherichia coli TaxID=562 RepID=UPI0037DD30F3
MSWWELVGFGGYGWFYGGEESEMNARVAGVFARFFDITVVETNMRKNILSNE